MAKMTKTEKLLREIYRRGGMNHREIMTFIQTMHIRERGDAIVGNDMWNAQIYGTKNREGLLDRFIWRSGVDGRYHLESSVNICGPFYPRRCSV